ncbi:MAG TPA: hypothetical protein VK459_06890 [Polyangiaceae bacterium]|jgi:hypothetical protein|nr:hypothetical protein [Polyangiaceae bacterium]
MFLHQSPHVVIARLPGTTIIRFKRLKESPRTALEVRTQLQKTVDALNTVDRRAYSLLMDMRDAPMLHVVPEFEQILDEYRPRIMSGFAKVAVLVKTSVGKLQVTRMAREDGVDIRIFNDEAEALAYLTGRPEAR